MTDRAPRTLGQLMAWFVAAWGEEMPTRLHERGVWHDRTGGSALGSPAMAAPMRRLIEGSPHATDFDPRLDMWEGAAAHLTPIRSALAELRRTSPFMARDLWRIACRGDWRDLDAWIPERYREAYVHEALRRLWRIYAHREAQAA